MGPSASSLRSSPQDDKEHFFLPANVTLANAMNSFQCHEFLD
jgi:hypothetical protein